MVITGGNDCCQQAVLFGVFTLLLNFFYSTKMANNTILDKRTEIKWLATAIVFLVLYCGFLFFFRSVLMKLENGNGTILKPEPGQIIAMGLLILVYHLSYAGLYAFSGLGKLPAIMAALLAVFINLAFMYGFKLWFDAIAGNIFLLSIQKLPWYAQEKTKFIIANAPLLLYFISVFAFRLIAIGQRLFSSANGRAIA